MSLEEEFEESESKPAPRKRKKFSHYQTSELTLHRIARKFPQQFEDLRTIEARAKHRGRPLLTIRENGIVLDDEIYRLMHGNKNSNWMESWYLKHHDLGRNLPRNEKARNSQDWLSPWGRRLLIELGKWREFQLWDQLEYLFDEEEPTFMNPKSTANAIPPLSLEECLLTLDEILDDKFFTDHAKDFPDEEDKNKYIIGMAWQRIAGRHRGEAKASEIFQTAREQWLAKRRTDSSHSKNPALEVHV